MHLERDVAGIRDAVDALTRYAIAAGLDAQVPTTPGWDVRQLLAHQGEVHRWAASTIIGEESDRHAVEAEGRRSGDVLGWLQEGAARLVSAIEAAPSDLDVLVFLPNAPPAREFWARRQCHETTIHAVDALAASLMRRPCAADTWIDREVALDGIDELLTGLLPQPRSRLRSLEPTTLAVLPDGSDVRWLVTVSEDPPVTQRDRGDHHADVVVRGSAVALYLALWNRSDEVIAEGFGLWAELVRV